MLGKLIKHEFRATSRVMGPMLLVLAGLAVVANISFAVIDKVGNSFLNMLMGLLIAAYFICIFAVAVITIVIVVERFYKNLMGDQGYLMMTLPTDVHALVWSKLIVSLVWMIVSALAIMLTLIATGIIVSGMAMTAAEFGELPSLAQVLAMISEETGFTPAALVGMGVEFAVIIVFASMLTCLHFYAAMSIGHSFTNHKVLWSVVFFFVINVALQIISMGCALLVGVSVDHALSDFGFEIFAYALHFMLALTVVEGAVLYFASVLPLKKGLNLT